MRHGKKADKVKGILSSKELTDGEKLNAIAEIFYTDESSGDDFFFIGRRVLNRMGMYHAVSGGFLSANV